MLTFSSINNKMADAIDIDYYMKNNHKLDALSVWATSTSSATLFASGVSSFSSVFSFVRCITAGFPKGCNFMIRAMYGTAHCIVLYYFFGFLERAFWQSHFIL
jgi:hypothetical protein